MGKWKKFINVLNEHANNIGYPYIIFGIYCFISFPLFHIIWRFAHPGLYDNLVLRIIAMLLGIPLILKNYWPKEIKGYLPLYWYITVLFVFPFFFTYVILNDNFSDVSVLNVMTVIVQLILVLDIISLLIILPLGVILGIIAYYFTCPHVALTADYRSILVTYSTVIILGMLFMYSRESQQLKRVYREKMRSMTRMGSSIAHELRTPLLSIRSAVRGVSDYLPRLITSYQVAKKAGLEVPEIQPRHLEVLKNALSNVEAETHLANSTINILLVNISRHHIDESTFVNCSMTECINEALDRYPFYPKSQRKLVNWKCENDFIFRGSKELIIHVIFNLLKNALYYLERAGKGEIYIWLEHRKHLNVLHFKDTGMGISTKILPHIFDRFFSETHGGSGIGLSYAKMVMESFKGEINCYSEEGEYTEFVLIFESV